MKKIIPLILVILFTTVYQLGNTEEPEENVTSETLPEEDYDFDNYADYPAPPYDQPVGPLMDSSSFQPESTEMLLPEKPNPSAETENHNSTKVRETAFEREAGMKIRPSQSSGNLDSTVGGSCRSDTECGTGSICLKTGSTYGTCVKTH